MSVNNPVWYLNYGDGSSTGYYANSVWAATTAKTVGQIVRQVSPANGSERLFICIIAGTTLASEPTWVLTRGAKTAEAAGPTWMECTGLAALNNDMTNTQAWAASAGARALGDVIKNVAATKLFICTTAGTGGTGSEPTWNTTTGNTTVDNGATWTCIGSTGAFANWASPAARCATLYKANWALAGETIYVAGSHAETQATAITVTGTGTLANPAKIICVNQAGSVPPVSADVKTTPTASITASGNVSLTFTGAHFMSGVSLSCAAANGSISEGDNGTYLKNCALLCTAAGNSSAAGNISATAYRTWDNVTVSLNGSGNAVCMTGVWKNTTSAIVSLGTLPTFLFGTSRGPLVIDNVDLSAMGSGKTLLQSGSISNATVLMNCKIGASVTVSGATAAPFTYMDVVNCDSGNTGYRQERYGYAATLSTETTDVLAASDGVNTISWKLVSTTNAKVQSAFETFPIVAWNTATGSSKTATIEIMNDGTTLTNNDVWLELHYLDSASFPTAAQVSSAPADQVAAATNVTTSTASWVTTGITTPIKQKLQVTFTPLRVGAVRAVVRFAKASKTIYVDPVLTIT